MSIELSRLYDETDPRVIPVISDEELKQLQKEVSENLEVEKVKLPCPSCDTHVPQLGQVDEEGRELFQ